MLAFIEELYLISVAEEGTDSPGAILAEVSADDDYSWEMELQAYRAALKLLDPDLEPPVQRSWNRADNAPGGDGDSGSYAIPTAEL